MKKLTQLFIPLIFILSILACSEDDDRPLTAKQDPDGIAFTAPSSEIYRLSASNSDSIAENFTWSEVDFNVETPVSYELQGSSKEDFGEYSVLGTVKEPQFPVTVGNMMTLAREADLDNDPETDLPNSGSIFFRVRAYIGTNGSNPVEQISDPIMVSVWLSEDATPGKRVLYLVGDATAVQWMINSNNMPLFRDAEDDDLYYFIGRFAGGSEVEGFKLLENLDNWQPQWGVFEGSAVSSETLGKDPDAFKVPDNGYFNFSINVADGSFSLEKMEQDQAPIYTAIGVLGDATANGWDADIDLTPSEFNPHIWYLHDLVLTEGKFKFRANDAWDTSWGTTSTTLSGKTTLGGEDIPATAGSYDLWFNDLDGRYILIPKRSN